MTDHQHDWCAPGNALDLTFTIDFWQGPTDALVRCSRCGAFALLRLLHWSGPNLRTRVYALSELPARAVTVFLRNMRSDYCDLGRHQAEVDALIATAGPVSDVLVVDAASLRTLAHHDADVMRDRVVSWRRSTPDETDPHWLELVRE